MARRLFKTPGFTAIALLTLALGIGCCTAMFSVIRAVLLKPLPFREPARLVWIANYYAGARGLTATTTQVDNLLDWRKAAKSFDGIGGYFAFYDYYTHVLTGQGEPQQVRGIGVTENFLKILGVQPMIGREFTAEECAWNGPHAILLSHGYWLRRFGGDRSIVGTFVTINAKPVQVVGVMPATFDFGAIFTPGVQIDYLEPFPLVEQTSNLGNSMAVVARLKPGVSERQAAAELAVIDQRIRKDHPERYSFDAHITGLEKHIRGPYRQPFFVLSAAVVCVLLIACLNLSGLLLARTCARQQELAVRSALGASRWRLIGPIAAECFVLACGGSLLGVALAAYATNCIARFTQLDVPLLASTGLDSVVLIFTLGLCAFATFAAAFLPAWKLLCRDQDNPLEALSHRSTGGLSTAAVQKILIVVETALACVLLIGAGLLIRSFGHLLAVNPGFNYQDAATWQIRSIRQFSNVPEALSYFEGLARQVETVPGVEAVGETDSLPLGKNRYWTIRAKGRPHVRGQTFGAVPRIVDHRYLACMKIPLMAGRYFSAADQANNLNVVIINKTLAHRLWPNESAVGKSAFVYSTPAQVVGVVGDVRFDTLEAAPEPEMYLLSSKFGAGFDSWNQIELVVRSSRPTESLANDVRSVLAAYDPNLPRSDFKTLEQVVDSTLAWRRLVTDFLTAFSGLALVLAAIGLYGVISYSVGQRTHELGIRIAVGAQRRKILELVLREGLAVAGIGAAVGVFGSLLVNRLLRGLLFGISGADPLNIGLTVIVVIAVALLACFVPAWRATQVDPINALRTE